MNTTDRTRDPQTSEPHDPLLVDRFQALGQHLDDAIEGVADAGWDLNVTGDYIQITYWFDDPDVGEVAGSGLAQHARTAS